MERSPAHASAPAQLQSSKCLCLFRGGWRLFSISFLCTALDWRHVPCRSKPLRGLRQHYELFLELCASFPNSGPPPRLPSTVSCSFHCVRYFLELTTCRIMGPIAMGFGLTRKTVFNHLRYMTWQALEGQHSKEGNSVSETSYQIASKVLTTIPANRREHQSVDSRNGQD